jgi:hypothetical protein
MSALPRDDAMFEDSVITTILKSISDMSISLGNLTAKQDSIEKTLDKVQENVAHNTKEITGFKTIENKIPNLSSFIRWILSFWAGSIVGVCWLMWHGIKFLAINFPQFLH